MKFIPGDDISTMARDTDKRWLVVGWFTPGYKGLAKSFAAQLEARKIPHHLYAVEDFGSSFFERTRAKPSVVLRAIDQWPGHSVILMDVDCIISGDIFPLLEDSAHCDVAMLIKVRAIKSPRLSIAASSRVMVFQPTPRARGFANYWRSLCVDPDNAAHDDELCLAWTFVMRSDVSIGDLPIAYSAREEDQLAGVEQIIAHRSENAQRTYTPFSLRRGLKSIEKRLFRSGRSANWREGVRKA